jgi:hypothetical protein
VLSREATHTIFYSLWPGHANHYTKNTKLNNRLLIMCHKNMKLNNRLLIMCHKNMKLNKVLAKIFIFAAFMQKKKMK